MKEAIAKALSAHANEGASQEGLMTVTQNVLDVVNNVMEVIANDEGDDFREDWQFSDKDMEKVVAKTNQLTTQTETDMDTRETSTGNPLLGPTASGQEQPGGIYRPPHQAAQPQETPDDEMAEDDATLKQ